MKTESNKLTKSDLNKVGLRSMFYQMCFNYERMQAGSFAWCLLPGLKKIYKDNDNEVGDALENNLDFINTEQHAASFLMGLILAMEENHEDRGLIKNLKTGLFGPLAGIGDAVFWFTLLPVTAAICTSLNSQGSVLGPILYIATWIFLALTRVWFLRAGYNLGTNAITMITKNAKQITKAAGILGVMVIGGMVPLYVSFSFAKDLKLFNAVQVQAIFDDIIPNLLPAIFVGLVYFLLKKKNVNILVLILGIIIFSILMSLLGLM
ncbi:PTS system mannose/fructose/sorbose family transporter subunit IID [Caproiciproducens sp.]|uniref:PTS system mannose/fructose/sorbose family transporter subunit IID n=1 Tax=Caproiciproducens sp. TaxID=1954376 RepID=UPI00289CBA65|nr:PTS system mannose/fructose/sorbose family transporter subunit IID [Caproiciproducens sp.]